MQCTEEVQPLRSTSELHDSSDSSDGNFISTTRGSVHEGPTWKEQVTMR